MLEVGEEGVTLNISQLKITRVISPRGALGEIEKQSVKCEKIEVNHSLPADLGRFCAAG